MTKTRVPVKNDIRVSETHEQQAVTPQRLHATLIAILEDVGPDVAYIRTKEPRKDYRRYLTGWQGQI